MKAPAIVLLVAAMATPASLPAREKAVDGSAAAIRGVISGQTCHGTGEDILIFGESGPGLPGTFERRGRPRGTYSTGYGTILIRRGQDLHGHVTSVSVPDHVLYMSTGTYRCGERVE